MSDLDALWAALEKDPDDFDTRRVMADLLEEEGDPRHEALRWQIAGKKRPHFDEDTDSWDWWEDSAGEKFAQVPQALTSCMSDRVGWKTANFREFNTLRQAEEALWQAWLQVRDPVSKT